MTRANDDRLRSNVQQFRDRTERTEPHQEAGQQVLGAGVAALVVASAVGAVVGEWAKRKTFDDAS